MTLEEHAGDEHGSPPPPRSGLAGKWRRALCNARASGSLPASLLARALHPAPAARAAVREGPFPDPDHSCPSPLRSEGVPARPAGRGYATLHITASAMSTRRGRKERARSRGLPRRVTPLARLTSASTSARKRAPSSRARASGAPRKGYRSALRAGCRRAWQCA
jgi:hypothetical protein